MAFGKNREAMKPNSFAQRAKRSMQKPKGGQGGGAPYFVNQYKPSTHMVDTIRLLPGSYQTPIVDFDAKDLMRDEAGQVLFEVEPYVQFTEHYSGAKSKSSICSAGPLGGFKGKGEPCLACDWFWYEWRVRQATGNKQKPKSISKREMWAFSVLVQAPFHKVIDVDENQQPRINPNTKQPYYKWWMCQGRGCEHCQAGREVKQGHVQSWSMGRDHFNTLIDYSNIISKHCGMCGTEDCIEELAYVCGHEDCGDAVIDLATTSFNNKQIEEMSTTAVQCPTCKRKTFLSCMFRCPVCEPAGRAGSRATIFDVDFKVKRIEDTSGESNKTTLSIVGTSKPGQINSLYGEDLRKPLDLPKIFTPTDMARQLAFFGEVPTEEVVRQPVT
jgi:hypothetical protein